MKTLVKQLLYRLGLLGLATTLYVEVDDRTRKALQVVHTIQHNVPYRLTQAPDGLPIPPQHLRSLVWQPYSDIGLFLEDSQFAARMLATLGQLGADPSSFRVILDFGCGAGRITRQFHALRQSLGGVQVYGADINPEQVAWCSQNLPFARFVVTDPSPPLLFRDEQFDFIYTLSVFTHLAEAQQRPWIDELARVVRPGGFLLITTLGESYFETLNEHEQRIFRSGELVVRREELAGMPSTYGYCLAFHPSEYVKERLAGDFEIAYHVPALSTARRKGEQDHYFLRRTAGPGQTSQASGLVGWLDSRSSA